MYVGSALACSVQNSAMPAPDAVVTASRARVDQLDKQVEACFGAMFRAVNRPASDLSNLNLSSQTSGYNPPSPYGTGGSGLPSGVSPNNGGAGADTEPQAPYVEDPWPVGLPAAVCSAVPSVNGQPSTPVWVAPLSASKYLAPAASAAPVQFPNVVSPSQPAVAPPPSYRARSVRESELADQYARANQQQEAYQAEVRAAIQKADPGGKLAVELVYPGQAPGSPRYAAGYGSQPGTQPAVYVGGRLVMPSRVLPAPGLPMQQAQGLRGLGCADCGAGDGGFLTSFLGSLAASGALLLMARHFLKGGISE